MGARWSHIIILWLFPRDIHFYIVACASQSWTHLTLLAQRPEYFRVTYLTHWGRVTHICVSKLTIIASDNGLSPDGRQAIIWTNAGLLLIGPLGTNFSEILIEILTFSFKKMHLKMSSENWRPIPLGLNVLNHRCWSPGDERSRHINSSGIECTV